MSRVECSQCKKLREQLRQADVDLQKMVSDAHVCQMRIAELEFQERKRKQGLINTVKLLLRRE